MVFVEFQSDKGPDYFVGASLEDVLADTNGGKSFSYRRYSGYRKITEAEAHALNLGYLEEGIASIRKGDKSFMLGNPR